MKKKKKKHFNPICEHLGWENERDCEQESEYICLCCAMSVCREHKKSVCPYGGMAYIEIEEKP